MRVLWLSHFVPAPPSGGALQRSHGLLREAARRHEVHLVALNQRALLPDDDARRAALAQLDCCASVRVFDIPADRSRARRLMTTAVGYLRSAPYDVLWLTSAPFRRQVRELLRTEPFDLVHVDTLGLLPVLPPDPPCPVLLNHHNVESFMTQRRALREQRWWARRYLLRDADKLLSFERRWCPRVDVNTVVSTLDAERLGRITGDCEAVVVPNGVDVEHFRPERGGDPSHLIFTGSLGWYPNHRAARYILDEIWPRLARDDDNWRLSLVGRGPPADLVSDDPRVDIPGEVRDMRPYLERAGIYVCPIRDGAGTRLKILDAMAMECALVATEFAVEGLGLLPDVHYLRAERPETFERQIRRLRDDPALVRRLAAAGRAVVEARFAWSVIGTQLESAYRIAVTPRRAVA
jgi:glycosyltransferase involved in cell wall biosynthesis